MRISQSFKHFLQLPTDQPIDCEVRHNFRRNFINNALDGIFWMLGESFVSVSTILPVFASTLTDSPVLIGLVPALINAGWFLPQLLMAGHVQRLAQKMPFARAMAIVERLPYLVLPLTAYLLHWISVELALIFFMLVIAWRGVASGMVALPWQEVIASVIPSPVRSRFFGVSRTIGRIMGVLGSIISGTVLALMTYPNNYALSFLIGAVFIWVSYFFFAKTIEPMTEIKESDNIPNRNRNLLNDFQEYKATLQRDLNFVKYLISRTFFQMSSMAIAFLAVYGIQHYRLADEQAAIFTGIIFFSGTIGFLLYGWIGDRLGPRTVLLISDGMQAISLLLTLFNLGVWSIYIIFLILGFAQSGYIIGELIIVMELGPDEKRPTYIGLARTLPGFIILIAPLIGGLLVGQLGYRMMFTTALVFSVGGTLLLFGVKDRSRVSNSKT